MRPHWLIVIALPLFLCPHVAAQTSASGAPELATAGTFDAELLNESTSDAVGEFPFRLASQLDLTGPVIDASVMVPEESLQVLPAEEPLRESPPQSLPGVATAFELSDDSVSAVQPIATTWVTPSSNARVVRYDVPLNDAQIHQSFRNRGIRGRLVEVVDKESEKERSLSERLTWFWNPDAHRRKQQKVRLVRYEVPADDIQFHADHTSLDGRILEPGMLRLPEVRFFQPKARVFMDLKRKNDDEFDLFSDGAILASLDVIELYFPMPLISERFAEFSGKPARLASLGWRVGGTIGLGITSALTNGTSDNGSSPISTLSTGIRYEFPLGRPSRELLETRDRRLDQRTRVGMEFGFQGGISTRESLSDATDVGMYFGIMVNTPWGG